MSSKKSDFLHVVHQTTIIVVALFLSLLPYLFYGCAQVAQPPGGKKDTIAPLLIESTPVNKQKNFKGRDIELFFSEYVQIENLVQKTIITPGTGNTFSFKLRPTSLLLHFNEPFKDTTTYTISFTDAIRDASERNPAANLKLVFSTGPQIDSLTVSGNVTDINSGERVKEALVGLYTPRDTLDATRNKPVYYSKTDTSGNFLIENVKAGNYDLIAFNDVNKNFVFNADVEKVGFYEKRIILKQNVDGIKVALYSQNNTTMRIARTQSRSDKYSIFLNKGAESYSVRFKQPTDSIPSIRSTATEVTFFRPQGQTTADTIPVFLTVKDSLGVQTNLKHTINFRPKSRREKPEPFTITADPVTGEDVERNFTLALLFNKPVGQVNPTSIQIRADSAQLIPFDERNITWLNTHSRLELPIQSKAKRDVQIKLDKDAFISIQGDTITGISLRYDILNTEDFGLLRGEVITKEPNYFIELVDERGRIAQHQKNVVAFTFKNIKPGRYRMRLIIDRNNNNRWDIGNYQLRLPPEPIIYFPTVLPVKQNFEQEGLQLQY